MTNRIAIILAIVIVAVFAADLLYYHLDLHVFLGKQLMRLIDVVAFWR